MNTDYYINLQSENELRIEQNVLFNYYIQFLSLNSNEKIYSCNFKQDEWDTRIINLSTNVIYRFSYPSFTKDLARLDKIRKIFSKLENDKLSAVMSVGICEQQLWFERKLYHKNNLLSEIYNYENNIFTFLDVIIDILNYVKILWDNEIYHGNISLNNIVLDGNKYILIDPVYAFVAKNNEFPTLEDDIKSLKSLIKKIADEKKCNLLEPIIDIINKDNISLAISKVNEIKRNLYTPLSSGVLIKKGSHQGGDEGNENLGISKGLESNSLNNVSNDIKSGKIISSSNSNENLNDNINQFLNNSFESNANYHVKHKQNLLRPLETKDNSSSTMFLYILIFILLGMIAYYGKDRLKSFGLGSGGEKLAEYEYSWNTNQAVLMREVLEQALDNDKLAQSVIVNFAFDNSKTSMYVDSVILKTIFNPLWESSLTDDDRYTALRLGLAKLVTYEEKKVPLKTLSELHPSIALAVSGSVNLDATNSQLDAVALDYMSNLSSFYGDSYKKLSLLGVKNLGELSSRALSSILVLGGNEENISGFFVDSITNSIAIRGKLYILLDLLNQGLVKADMLYLIVNKYFKKPIKEYIDFFNTNDWKGIDKLDVLNFIVGRMPKKQLELLQYIDLLSYPSNEIRQSAANVLKSSKKLNKKVLDYIAQGNTKLSREQLYILMSLFLIEGDKQHAVIDKFLSTKPDIVTSLKILLFRNKENNDDLFNFEVSRYLSHQDLKLSEDEIWQLVKHPEPMARAIGYSNLDLKNQKHKKYLEEKRKTETSDLLKVLIAKRLE